jgi:hypothetical protein
MKEGGLNVVAKEEPGPALPVDRDPEFVLRAKYLDYCSAQLADVLLLLSPDEMYVLAEDAAREAGLAGELGFDQIVSLATERVSRKLALPPFDVWLRDYQANPEGYEDYLMGLWESELQGLFDR